ncbi:MAG: hypothetical protein PHR20_02210 [Bacteroidales bacterium]|nr:hypothetical protein [Bacteroidales bacterium]
MKKFIIILFISLSALYLSAQETEINGCYATTFYGNETKGPFELYGNVFVETDPKEHVDICVKIVDSPKKATYNIFKTTDTPQKCGEWRFVDDRSKAKFTIRYVKEPDWWEDCRIYFTTDRNQAGF